MRIAVPVASFALGAATMLAVFVAHGAFPFGSRSILFIDGEVQYAPFFAYLGRALRGEDSLTYTLSMGLGGDPVGVLAYYLGSPLNLALAFVAERDVPVAFLWLAVTKVGLAGAASGWYLHRRFGSVPTALLFSTSYALMAFDVAYFFNIMWLDAVILLPLVAAGVEGLVERRPGALPRYTVPLALALLVNYYTAYMVCLFAVLHFVAHVIRTAGDLPPGRRVRTLLRPAATFAAGSLLATGLAAAVLVPVVASLQGGRGSMGAVSRALAPDTGGAALFERLYTGVQTGQELIAGRPHLYVGTVALYFAVLFLVSRAHGRAVRFATALVLGALLVSFVVPQVHVAWHAFSAPNWFPHRFSYLFSFVVVVAAAEAFAHRDRLRRAEHAATALVLVVATLLLFGGRPAGVDLRWVVLDAVLLLVVAATGLVTPADPRRWNTALAAALLVANVGQLGLNGLLTVRATSERFPTEAPLDRVARSDAVGSLVARVREADAPLARLETHDRSYRTGNDPLRFGFAGVSQFTSSDRQDWKEFIGRLGMRSNWMWGAYDDAGLEAMDSVLGIRHVIARAGALEHHYPEVARVAGHTAHVNPDAWPLLYATTRAARDIDLVTGTLDADAPTTQGDVFAHVNDLYRALGVSGGDVLHPIGVDDVRFVNLTTDPGDPTTHRRVDPGAPAHLEFRVRVPAAGVVALFLDSPAEQNVELSVNGGAASPYMGRHSWGVRRLGDHRAGDVLVVRAALAAKAQSVTISGIHVAQQDAAALRRHTDALAGQGSQLTAPSGDHLVGRLVVPEGQDTLVVSVPYDPGWALTVDGHPVPTSRAYGVLLSATVAPGAHVVELRYARAGASAGFAVSVVSGLVLLVVLVRGRVTRSGGGRRVAGAAPDAAPRRGRRSAPPPPAG